MSDEFLVFADQSGKYMRWNHHHRHEEKNFNALAKWKMNDFQGSEGKVFIASSNLDLFFRQTVEEAEIIGNHIDLLLNLVSIDSREMQK